MLRTILPALLFLASSISAAEPKKKTIDYARDVRPILSNNCFACHGPDQKTLKGNLRLDSRESSLKSGWSDKPAIIPGKASESEMVRRIFDTSEVMPPAKSNKKLTAAEKDILKRWIDEGAEYKVHWSFLKPAKPASPSVENAAWKKNEIDAFLLSRLEKTGLKPSSEAGRITLIRRLSFDLRGLPPSIKEVDEFLADTRPDAYEQLVGRMLASPRYGEKMATLWLDLARFGDTSGYHYDSTRQMWVWRDWVIGAYNKNLPFDQFTTWQLAGDLLPNATVEQKIASGFNRNTRFNEEGGADPEEFVVRYNIDRTATLGQVWMGLTLGCAECHSHKYDPITHKEFYQLYAFFTRIKEPMASGNHGQALAPLLRVSQPEQERLLAAVEKDISGVQTLIAAELKKAVYAEPTVVSAKPKEPKDTVWIDDDVPAGALLQGDGPTPWQWVTAPAPVLSGKRSTKRSSPALTQHYFTAAQPLSIGSAEDRLFAHVWLDPKSPPKSVMLQWNDGSWEHRAYWGEDRCFLAGGADAPNHRKMGPLPKAGEWVRLEIDPKLVGLAPGAKLNGWAFTQFDGTVYWDKAGLRSASADESYLLSLKAWEPRGKADPKVSADVKAALNTMPDKRNEAQMALIRDHYLRNVYSGTRGVFDPLNKKLDELAAQRKKIDDGIPTVMVSEEMDKPRDAFVLIRGDFLQRGEKVTREVPSIFPPLPKDAPRNRLGLAQWLTSPEHPLTARVAVNRLWAQMFGTGLVKTIGDLGTQGELPSHPELLDWLAADFIASGWDTKAMLKKIALSSAYRQASVRAEKATESDPENRLLHRAPRFRLSAEEVRDNALAVAGMLSERIGGPSVMPYQPGDFYKGKNEGWKWDEAKGDDLYRRGMYTFWRRTSLHPMFALFDAPSREDCTVFRPRTNTPLQALVTLNDTAFFEAARVFAQRILMEGPADVEGRIGFAFRAAVARKPNAAEMQVLKKRHQMLTERYKRDTNAAAEVVKAGRFPKPEKLDVVEHATWTALANLLLNLDETLTRE